VPESVPVKTYIEQPLLDNKDCFSEDKTKGIENTIKKLTAIPSSQYTTCGSP